MTDNTLSPHQSPQPPTAWPASGEFLGMRHSGPALEQFLDGMVELARGPREHTRLVTYLNAACENLQLSPRVQLPSLKA